MQKQIEIFTDGSCLGNPGPGGIGVLLRYKQHEKQISAGYFLTTNNRMELRAVIEALNTLKEPCSVTLHSDSQYMKNGITKWIFNWKKITGKPAPASPLRTKIYGYSSIKLSNVTTSIGNGSKGILDTLKMKSAINSLKRAQKILRCKMWAISLNKTFPKTTALFGYFSCQKTHVPH